VIDEAARVDILNSAVLAAFEYVKTTWIVGGPQLSSPAGNNADAKLYTDPMQLPPTVLAPGISPKSLLDHMPSIQSVFDQRHPNGRGTSWLYYYLPDCFRCHPQITEFPSQQYYGGTVHSYGKPKRHPGHDLFPPSSFIDVSPYGLDRSTHPRQSMAQTQVLDALLDILHEVEGPSIMVLVYFKDE